MKEILLTQGMTAVIDDEDYDFINQWKWHAFKSLNGKFYACRNSPFDPEGRRTHIFMHRVLADTPDGFDTDHINGNPLDNRRNNLRVANRAQNMWNRAPNKKGSSPHKGVHWHKQHKKWCVSIQVNKRRMHLGLFDSEIEAAEVYASKAATEFGEFNRRN